MNGQSRNAAVMFGAVFFIAFFLGTALLQAAESTSDVVVDTAQKEKLRQEIVGNVPLPGEDKEYIIGYSDILSITIYGEGDMSATDAVAASRPAGDTIRRRPGGVEVRMDGRVSLKHVGDVKVVGMSLTQLADYLKKLYVSVFDDPIVTVTLLQSNSRRYTVMGKVNAPGIFYLDFPVTIVQAIARSGGFNEWANHEITVIRQGNGLSSGTSEQPKSVQFDYDAFLKGKDLEDNVYLHANDVVIVH